jgi:hypothetical protein
VAGGSVEENARFGGKLVIPGPEGCSEPDPRQGMKEVGVGSQSGEWLTAQGFSCKSEGFGLISKYLRDLVPTVPLKSLVVKAAIGQLPESDPAIGQGGTIRRMEIVEQHGGVEG